MVKVCFICGDGGFSNALLYCSYCSDVYAHQYCLGIPPGSIDDTFDWVCEYCFVRVEPASSTFQKFGVTFSRKALKSCSEHAGDFITQSTSDIATFPDQPEPLFILFPMQYNGTSTREKSSNQSQKQGTISSYMEHPDSIMRGLILLVSPSGEVFIHIGMTFCDYSHGLASQIVNLTSHSNYTDSKFKKLGDYNVNNGSSPLRNNEHYDSEDTLELHERKIRTLDEIYAQLNETSKCTTITGQTNSSVVDRRTVKRRRTVEPAVEVMQRKRASVYKDGEVDAEGSGSKTTRILRKHELDKQKNNNCKTKNGRNRELSSETLVPTRKMVRKQIVTMLLNAGWTVEYRRRRSKRYKDAVYVNPQGKDHYSAPIAYHALLQDIKKGKSKKGKAGNSSSCFRPIPKEVLSVLCNRDQRSS